MVVGGGGGGATSFLSVLVNKVSNQNLCVVWAWLRHNFCPQEALCADKLVFFSTHISLHKKYKNKAGFVPTRYQKSFKDAAKFIH
jgi:hypothetical protein